MYRLLIALVTLTFTAPAIAQSTIGEDDTPLVLLQTSDDGRGWAGVGKLMLGTRGFCTGALIATDLVLTAGHCVYGPDGAPVASRGLGGPEADSGMAVAIGPDGRVVLAGLHGVGLDVGAGPFPAGIDGFDAFFAVFEPDGKLAWSHGGVPVASFDLGVDIDASGRVVALTRAVSVETDFGGGPAPPSNGAYLVKYGTDGAVAWVHALDGTVELYGHGLDVDADGRIAVSGSFNPSLMYPDIDTINSAGEFDVFAGRFQP